MESIIAELKDNSAFLCLAKMLVAVVIRMTILVEPFGLAYLQLKRMPRRTRSYWWRVCHE